jgi:hypothetical protein
MFANGKLQGAPFTPVETQVTPQLNGGLFTGEKFKEGSAWGNIPVKPDTGYLINQNLRSANPPPLAIYHYPGAVHRPGNNTPTLPGIVNCNGLYLIDDDRKMSNDCNTYCAGFPRQGSC